MSGGPYTIPYSGSRAKGPEHGYVPDSTDPGNLSRGFGAAPSGYQQPVVASDAAPGNASYGAGHHNKGPSCDAPTATSLCHPKYVGAGVSSGALNEDGKSKSDVVHMAPVSSPKKNDLTKETAIHRTHDGASDEREIVPELKAFDAATQGSNMKYPCGNCHLFVLHLKRRPDFCDVCREIPDCKDCGRDYPEMSEDGMRRPSIGFTFPNGNVAVYDAPKPEFPFDLAGDYPRVKLVRD
ncbi:hypothetical protein ACHAQA_009646 [Verticillium albo-atrum]